MARGLLVWLLIMTAETAHGVLRGLLLVPRVGEAAASSVGLAIGALLALLISFIAIRWTGVRGTSRLLALGAVWAVLTLAFEMAIGLLRGLDAAQLLAALDPLSGGMVPWTLGVMLLAPLIAARLRRSTA